MDQSVIDEKIQAVAAKIVEKFHPEKIILFGSWAWGNPTEDSDVDLFIVKNSEDQRMERETKLRMLLFPPGLPLDLLVYTPEEVKRRLAIGDFFVRDIIDKGKVLYAAT